MTKFSDEEVLEQMRLGRADALPILFDRYYRLVLKVAWTILRDVGEAEDVMQEVFFEIFNKVSQFDAAKGSPKTWILQYAYHRSLNRKQYLAHRKFYDRHQISEENIYDHAGQGSSWHGLTYREWRPVLELGLAELNEKQRRTIEMACFLGMSLTEVAGRTGESLPNVRHHYYRGLAALRKYLNGKIGTETAQRNSTPEANNAKS